MGLQGPAGPIGPAGAFVVPTCPSVSFADQSVMVEGAARRLCVYHEEFGKNWNGSQSDCFTFYQGASMCTYAEVRTACAAGAFTPISGSWLADRAADDSAFFVNIADCNNFDGVGPVTTNRAGKYCCISYPK